MKQLTIAFALCLGFARLSAQTTVESGTVTAVRIEWVKFKDLGRVKMQFVEADVEGKVQLLLLPMDYPVDKGHKLRIVSAYQEPRMVIIRGSKCFDYMEKYLNRR